MSQEIPFQHLTSTLIAEDDLKTYLELLSKNGYSKQDFKLKGYLYPTPRLDDPPAGTIVVKYRKTDIQRAYEIGEDTNWLKKFKDDLSNGVFFKG